MTTTRRGFVTAGCWCVDRNRTVAYWPAEDTAVEASAAVRRGGGSACNFAIDMRRLDPDMPVETIGLVGDDADGRYLREEAKRFGIDARRLQVTAAAPTHATDAFQSLASGKRTHITSVGAGNLLAPEHFDFDGVAGRILHLGLPGLHACMDRASGADANGWVTVLKRARQAGLATNLELVTVAPTTLAQLTMPCLPYLDTLIVNDFEIGALAGLDTVAGGRTDTATCEAAARTVLERGAMALVVVHYVEGALLVGRDGATVTQPSVRVPADAYRGANGAGDAFAAGFLYAHHEGWDHGRALRLAHGCAAASLRDVTTTDGVETVAACLALAEAWGWRG